MTQLHLCEKCAAERGIETTGRRRPSTRSGTSSRPCSSRSLQPRRGGRARAARTAARSLTDFRASGRLGCAHCYGAFEAQLRDLLRRVHGTTQHVGRALRRSPNPALLGARRELGASCATQLRRAIESEEFELAAELRDQIRG